MRERESQFGRMEAPKKNKSSDFDKISVSIDVIVIVSRVRSSIYVRSATCNFAVFLMVSTYRK